MTSWMVRGLTFAVAMVVVRLFQGALINAFQTQAGLISIVLMLFFAVAVSVWGLIDGRADARAQPDPDRRRDLAMIWLMAGLVAGVVSGAVVWIISMFYKGLYAGGLINEVTTFAAFTALLVFLPGMAAVTIGRWLIDRKADESRRSGGDEDRADTDVFDAVHEDETPTEGMSPIRGHDQEQTEAAAGERSEERPTAVATAEGERPTEAGPNAHREEQTRPARTDERTEPGPTASETEQTRTSRDDQR